jgi:hypothetical protein
MRGEANKKARAVLKAGASGDLTTAANVTWLREPLSLRRCRVLGYSAPMDSAGFHDWRQSVRPGVPQREPEEAA